MPLAPQAEAHPDQGVERQERAYRFIRQPPGKAHIYKEIRVILSQPEWSVAAHECAATCVGKTVPRTVFCSSSPGKQRFKLHPRQPHDPIANLRPGKTTLFQPLVNHHDPALAPWPLGPVARPWLTQNKTLTRSPRLDRNTTITSAFGAKPNSACASEANPS